MAVIAHCMAWKPLRRCPSRHCSRCRRCGTSCQANLRWVSTKPCSTTMSVQLTKRSVPRLFYRLFRHYPQPHPMWHICACLLLRESGDVWALWLTSGIDRGDIPYAILQAQEGQTKIPLIVGTASKLLLLNQHLHPAVVYLCDHKTRRSSEREGRGSGSDGVRVG